MQKRGCLERGLQSAETPASKGEQLVMKNLIDAIIKKWFCCHEWEYLFERRVEVVDDWGDRSWYTVRHYFCKKCGKYKKIKSH